MNVLELGPHDPSRLILLPRDLRKATNAASTDATTALTRGVAEYVSGLSVNVQGGRELKFVKAFDAWAEPEDDADYPSFAAYTNDQVGAYEAANLSPRVSGVRYPDGSYEASSAELVVQINCEVWANDPEERLALVKMLEDAFEPVDWRYGFVLELPHYYGQRASYTPLSVTMLGGPAEALKRFVNARFALRASVPKTRILGRPLAKPEQRTTVGTDPVDGG